jgi:hypothetical protein
MPTPIIYAVSQTTPKLKDLRQQLFLFTHDSEI